MDRSYTTHSEWNPANPLNGGPTAELAERPPEKDLSMFCVLCVVCGDFFKAAQPDLQQPRIERMRQQVFQAVRALAVGEVGEPDLEVAAELPQNLPARAAGRCRGL